MIKKSNIIGINLSDRAVVVLQACGVMTKTKRGKGLSSFISSLIENYAEIDRKDWLDYIEEKLIRKEVAELNLESQKLNERFDFLAQRLSVIREKNKLKKEFESDKNTNNQE